LFDVHRNSPIGKFADESSHATIVPKFLQTAWPSGLNPNAVRNISNEWASQQVFDGFFD
jgi:hypothetical protein